MKHLLIICSLITCGIAGANAQTLYMPREVKEAFKKETRSMDGKPGKNYWQNYGRYNITVTATPPDRNIKGSETIMYVNNSTDTIRNPVIKLFLNIHKPGAPRNIGARADYLTDGVQMDKVTVNNEAISMEKQSQCIYISVYAFTKTTGTTRFLCSLHSTGIIKYHCKVTAKA
jgi:hypothetical protein